MTLANKVHLQPSFLITKTKKKYFEIHVTHIEKKFARNFKYLAKIGSQNHKINTPLVSKNTRLFRKKPWNLLKVGTNMADSINDAYTMDKEAVPSPSSEFKLDCRLAIPWNAVKLRKNATQITSKFLRILNFCSLKNVYSVF